MTTLHVKSPNGTQKDIDLDKIFTTDGGTISGDLIMDSSWGTIKVGNDTDGLTMYGYPAVSGSDGAFLALFKYKNGHDGYFNLSAANNKILNGNPDGTLTWNGSFALTGTTNTPVVLLNTTNTPVLLNTTETSYRDIQTFSTDGNHRIGTIRMNKDDNNNCVVIIGANNTSNAPAKGITITRGASGDPSVTTVTPETSDNSNKIATTAYVQAQGYTTASGHNHDSTYVKLSGNQTVSGNKTFTADMYFENAAPKIIQTNSSDAVGTAPSSATQWYLRFYDKNNKNLGSVKHEHETNNDHTTGIVSRDKGESKWGGLIVRAASGGALSAEPYSTKTHSLGTSSKLWTTVYAQTATINTSDERAKTLIENIPDTILDVWGNVNLVRYKLKDSVNEKGDNARFHTGCIAQNVDAEFKKAGLDPREYGFFCYDEWDGKEATYDENGVEESPEIIAGNQYSIRYEEALIIEAAYQRRRADRLEERIARLEALLESK